MNKILMSVETAKIKDFIFSTNKLKVVRGASYLLDYLNQVKVKEILKNNGIEKEDIIYIGAGNAKFFVSTEESAKKVKKEIEEIYRKLAPNSKLVVCYREKADKKIWDVLDELAQDIAIAKSKGFSMINIDLPFVEKCHICNKNSAEISIANLEKDLDKVGIEKEYFDWKVVKDREELKQQLINQSSKEGKICEECLRKIIFSNLIKEDKAQSGFYHELEEVLDIDTDINTIDGYQAGNSFIGFMYADGDGLGDFLKNIKEKYINKNLAETLKEKEYIEFLKTFSETLDKNTKEALIEVLTNKDIKKDSNRELKFKDKVVGEFLIVGGDDVCAVFSPKDVFNIAERFQKRFETKMEEYRAKNDIEDRITSSCGVVIAKAKTPMYYLFDQTLALQKKAKARRYETLKTGDKKQATGYIDFQVIGAEGCVDVSKFREKISVEGNRTIERPYGIDEKSTKNVKNFCQLYNLITELKKINFPKTKLRYIYDLKQNNELQDYEKKMEFINILSKMKKEQRNFIKNNWAIEDENYFEEYNFFNKNFNNIFDILELYDFVGGDINEN